MRRLLIGLCFLVVVALLVRRAAGDDKKTDKKTDKKPPAGEKTEAKDKADAKDKLVPIGALVGKIGHVEGNQRYITLQISQPVLQRVGFGFQVAHVTQSLEIQATDDMKVRMLRPPVDFDQKGRPRKYTTKELKELKGPDPKLPGYVADFDSLKPDQIVQVYLARKKEALRRPSRRKNKDLEAEADPERSSSRPIVTMIMILQEPVR